MIHVRVDNEPLNENRKFACGIGPELPEGDKYYFEGESGAWLKADCPGCNPGGPKQLGTPVSQLSSTPGSHGFERFKAIAASWGYD